MRAGELDAVVLARAGLARIGRLDEATEVLDPLQMLPAPGQGALAVECRADDPLAGRARPRSTTPPPGPPSTAERAVLATLEAGCSAPVGALAEVAEGDDGDELWLRAVALSPDGALVVRLLRHPATSTDAAGARRPAWRARCSPTGARTARPVSCRPTPQHSRAEVQNA